MSMLEKEWSEKHAAFIGKKCSYRPEELRQRALVAINAGGPDGVAMTAVHKALASAHLPACLVNLIVDRLVDDGHAHRVREPTAGRPRVRMWSFRHAPEDVRSDMAYTGVWAPHDFSRMRWEGKSRENIIIEVLRAMKGAMLDVRCIEAAAGQIYIDADRKLVRVLYQGKLDNILTPGKVKAILCKMAQQRIILCNEHGDEFGIW